MHFWNSQSFAQVVSVAALVSTACLCSASAYAQSATPDPSTQTLSPSIEKLKVFKWDRFVPSGIDQKIGQVVTVNPDCSPTGKGYARSITPPQHGKMRFEDAEDFSSWPLNSVREKCNDKKYPSLRVMYQSDADYTGIDAASLIVLFSDGTAVEWDFTIDVR